MSRHVVIAIRRHAACQRVQVISASCCLLEVLFRPGYLKAAFFGYRFTSVLSCRCGLFRTFDPTSRPTALTPKAVYHPTQRTTPCRSLQSILHSGGFSASVAFWDATCYQLSHLTPIFWAVLCSDQYTFYARPRVESYALICSKMAIRPFTMHAYSYLYLHLSYPRIRVVYSTVHFLKLSYVSARSLMMRPFFFIRASNLFVSNWDRIDLTTSNSRTSACQLRLLLLGALGWIQHRCWATGISPYPI